MQPTTTQILIQLTKKALLSEESKPIRNALKKAKFELKSLPETATKIDCRAKFLDVFTQLLESVSSPVKPIVQEMLDALVLNNLERTKEIQCFLNIQIATILSSREKDYLYLCLAKTARLLEVVGTDDSRPEFIEYYEKIRQILGRSGIDIDKYKNLLPSEKPVPVIQRSDSEKVSDIKTIVTYALKNQLSDHDKNTFSKIVEISSADPTYLAQVYKLVEDVAHISAIEYVIIDEIKVLSESHASGSESEIRVRKIRYSLDKTWRTVALSTRGTHSVHSAFSRAIDLTKKILQDGVNDPATVAKYYDQLRDLFEDLDYGKDIERTRVKEVVDLLPVQTQTPVANVTSASFDAKLDLILKRLDDVQSQQSSVASITIKHPDYDRIHSIYCDSLKRTNPIVCAVCNKEKLKENTICVVCFQRYRKIEQTQGKLQKKQEKLQRKLEAFLAL